MINLELTDEQASALREFFQHTDLTDVQRDDGHRMNVLQMNSLQEIEHDLDKAITAADPQLNGSQPFNNEFDDDDGGGEHLEYFPGRNVTINTIADEAIDLLSMQDLELAEIGIKQLASQYGMSWDILVAAMNRRLVHRNQHLQNLKPPKQNKG